MTIACILIFFFKQKTAYEMRISDWSSDVCSSDLEVLSLDSVGDGVIQGAGVRVVLRADAGTEQISALADRVGAQLKAVPARFEDAFIDLLGGGPGGTSALAEGMPPVELASDVAVSCRDLTKRFGDFTAKIGRAHV